MNALSVVGSVMTVLALVVFISIVIWAWSKRRKKDFDEAAQAPFALPDDLDRIPDSDKIPDTNDEQKAEQRRRQS